MYKRQWLSYANEYVRQSDWKDLALIKLCLCSAGVLIGMSLAKRVKKLAAFGAMAVFIATYLPLMWKLLKIVTGDQMCIRDSFCTFRFPGGNRSRAGAHFVFIAADLHRARIDVGRVFPLSLIHI